MIHIQGNYLVYGENLKHEQISAIPRLGKFVPLSLTAEPRMGTNEGIRPDANLIPSLEKIRFAYWELNKRFSSNLNLLLKSKWLDEGWANLNAGASRNVR